MWTKALGGGDGTGGPAPPTAREAPPIALRPRPSSCSPARPSASHLRVVAAHLAPLAGGSAEVVVLALQVPLLHSQRHVHALVRDGEQVLPAPPALLVVAPHALLSVGLGEGGQLLVPPLRGGRRGRLGSAKAEAGWESQGRMPAIPGEEGWGFPGAPGDWKPSPPCWVTLGWDLAQVSLLVVSVGPPEVVDWLNLGPLTSCTDRLVFLNSHRVLGKEMRSCLGPCSY